MNNKLEKDKNYNNNIQTEIPDENTKYNIIHIINKNTLRVLFIISIFLNGLFINENTSVIANPNSPSNISI